MIILPAQVATEGISWIGFEVYIKNLVERSYQERLTRKFFRICFVSSLAHGKPRQFTLRVITAIQEFNESAFDQLIPDQDLKQKLKARLSTREKSVYQDANATRPDPGG